MILVSVNVLLVREERITSKFYQLRAGAKRNRSVSVCIMLEARS